MIYDNIFNNIYEILCLIKFYKKNLTDLKFLVFCFWMSRDEIMNLADENDNEECYEDAATSKERFVYKYLQNITLSPDAQEVLDMANDLVCNSFNLREQFNSDYPEYQINNWDCGYYQLKKLWSDYMPDEFRDFRLKYNKLADKMRPMVYELGFLKK